MLTEYASVYVTGTGAFLPGPPIDNEHIDAYIAPLNRGSARIKNRVLAENGIQLRHYAIDANGQTVFTNSEMAARAVHDCLADAHAGLEDVSLLCTGSCGGDAALPGFANMVQGELGAPPMATSSHQGICAAGVTAAQHAANALELGAHQSAVVVASEFPSRMFKRSRFAALGYDADFDAHFLRWMLSDGAGALHLSRIPAASGVSLKLDWIHTRSFSGDFPVCMQIGLGRDGRGPGYLDYDSVGAAEAAGAFSLRQDMRMLPNLFDVGVHEYARLTGAGHIEPSAVDHFLCHYSSEKFAGLVHELMQRAELSIPQNRWYSNLPVRGNTGAASIFIMLADFMRNVRPKPGERILCFVPESGRFTVCFLMLEVVEAPSPSAPPVNAHGAARAAEKPPDPRASPPVAAADAPDRPHLRTTLEGLAEIWHGFRSEMWRTDLVRCISRGTFSEAHYLDWMRCWIPQVRQGSQWMREAAASLSGRHAPLRALVESHATDEQHDYQMLFDDYRAAGGTATSIDALARNPGGEALNAYLFAKARRPDPFGLLGAIYIIEGTGQRIIPLLLPLMKRQLGLKRRAFRFLDYHAANDAAHLERWTRGLELVLALDRDDAIRDEILRTARDTARLYLMQIENVR